MPVKETAAAAAASPIWVATANERNCRA